MVGKQLIRSPLGILALAAISFAFTSIAWGQGPPVPPKLPDGSDIFDESGTVLAVMPGVVQVLTETKGTWLVQVMPGKSLVKITGSAEPTFLHGGIFVKFSGEIDDKGVLKEEVKELEIFTPMGKSSSGVFASGADEKAKPINKLAAGTYDIRGKVASYKDGEIVVVAGKKISGKVASDAKIAVNMQDFSFVQEHDTVKAKGFTYKNFGPDIQTSRPGKAVGTEVQISLAKTLTEPPRKGPVKPTKQPKIKPSEAPPAGDDDPFGFKKAGGEKK